MIELLHEDNMVVMSRYPDNYFDLAIVDPPYGIGESGGKDRRGKSKHLKKDWDNETPSIEYFNELQRVSKDQIIWGGNYFTDKLPVSRCWIAWDKKLYNSDFSDFELAWASFNKGTKIFIHSKNGGNVDFMKVDIIHPTQKPIKLYDWIYYNYTQPDFKILDTHLGSGSNAIAAHQFGIAEFVGCEIDKDYYEAAVKRFDLVTSQTQLFKAS